MQPSYGELIRRARKARQWRQEDVAARMRVTAATVSRWEREHTRPNLDQFEALSSLLGIPLDALIESGGVKLSPPTAARIYRPLADLLAEMPISSQRRLYDFLAQTREESALQ